MSAAEVANPRWWEGYLVRYMVGTPVGAFCVAAICHATFSSAKPYSQYLDTLHGKFASASLVVDATVAVAIAVISLAYCYIASSPITTFHATRMYRRSWFNRTSRYIWLGVWLLLLISVLFNFADTFILGVLAGPAVWTIFVQLLCVMRLHADDPANPNEKPIFIYGFLCNVLTGKKWE